MNSVHEPGLNGDSETITSRKPGKKTNLGARATNWPSWPSLCAQTARAWPCCGRPGRIMVGPLGRVVAPRELPPTPRALSRAPRACAPLVARACRARLRLRLAPACTPHVRLRRARTPAARRTRPARPAQRLATLAASVMIQILYRDSPNSPLPSHNTLLLYCDTAC